ncbi:hypothetical protein MNBD_ALPHA09-1611 [hydrothermal vent metagenome]|uniref:Tyrosine specific protein phosphatases domain-containing protein n=1 Tax=hydrothermal vent metagenome TaxID=652676 RepID=A0A3B0T0K2_9ZZZZ
MHIHVCPLPAIEATLRNSGAGHLLSVMGPSDMIDPWPGIEAGRHLRVTVNDIVAPGEGLVLAQTSHIEQIIEFVINWAARPPQAMVIHCWAGISRSTAAAYIALCALNETVPEASVARTLRTAAPFAKPNPRLVGLADTVLGRQGRMAAAIEALPEAERLATGRPFAVPAKLDAG